MTPKVQVALRLGYETVWMAASMLRVKDQVSLHDPRRPWAYHTVVAILDPPLGRAEGVSGGQAPEPILTLWERLAAL
jgi:hypothetical protein